MSELSQIEDQNQSHFVLFFGQHLTTEWKFERTPKGLPDLFDEAQSGRDESAQIFMSVNSKAWIAYCLAKKKTQGSQSYEGKHADQTTANGYLLYH